MGCFPYLAICIFILVRSLNVDAAFPSGVLHCSGIGPLLFLVMGNYLAGCLNIFYQLSANYPKIGGNILNIYLI